MLTTYPKHATCTCRTRIILSNPFSCLSKSKVRAIRSVGKPAMSVVAMTITNLSSLWRRSPSAGANTACTTSAKLTPDLTARTMSEAARDNVP